MKVKKFFTDENVGIVRSFSFDGMGIEFSLNLADCDQSFDFVIEDGPKNGNMETDEIRRIAREMFAFADLMDSEMPKTK